MLSGKRTRGRAIVVAVLAAIAVLAAVAGILLFNSGTLAPRNTGSFVVTIFPTPTAPTNTPAAPTATESISAAATETPAPTASPRVTQHTVQLNETLWDIALRYGFQTLDAIVAANPGLNPDLIKEGQVLVIPGVDFVPPPQPTRASAAAAESPQTTQAQVKRDAGGLRLRREPQVADNVLTKLSPLTPLSIIGRTSDDFWLQVTTPNGTTGWVMAQYVDLPTAAASAPALEQLPIAATAAPAAAASASQFEHPPYLSDLSPRVAEVFRAGQARGNRANVFALIGDSNTENPKFLRAYDIGGYDLGARYAYLQDTIRFFAGSFNRTSPAARGGFSTGKLLDPGLTDSSICSPGETPVDCELRIQRPSVALVLIGTGDQHSWQDFEARFRRIVQMTIDAGVVPVLITKGDDLEHRDNSAPSGYINSVIRRVALEYQMPLLNFSQVVDTLPARGFIEDGFHYNWPADGRSADLTTDKLSYGFNQRNLTALQALDVLRRSVIAP
jgi:LysM repeat protein